MSRRRPAIPLFVFPLILASQIACLDPCENSLIARVPSPNGDVAAVVFGRSCGATTDFSTQVSIIGAGTRMPKSAGNVFIADSNHGAAKDMTVTLRWLAPAQLVIRYPARARIFKKEQQVNGVLLQYEAVP